MHHAWEIEEIRSFIFQHLTPRSLAQLAQTCRALFNVASDDLWKTLNSVEPFLSCLPPDCRSRPLHLEDIRRLDLYASKVDKIIVENRHPQGDLLPPAQFALGNKKAKQNRLGKLKSWAELWTEIAQLRPASEFLPNLRQLRLYSAAEKALVPLIGISGSNLTYLYIRYIDNKQDGRFIPEFLNKLQETPNLRYLFVRDGGPDIPLKLIQEPPLVHLRLDPVIIHRRHDKDQFREFTLRPEILQKSTLEHLTLGLTQEWYSPEIPDKYLPALKTLWLNLNTFRTGSCEEPCESMSDNGWTSVSDQFEEDSSHGHTKSCRKRSPAVFLRRLDNPELSLLNIKFPVHTNGTMFMDIVSAANNSCRLKSLRELALVGNRWRSTCMECDKRPAPLIKPTELRQAMKLLLPLPQLKTLRLSVAPNFLDILDIDLYESITAGLPMLETLRLGHAEFHASSLFQGDTFYEKVVLHHLAAFCSMLPKLTEVSVGTVNGCVLEESPNAGWECPSVKSLAVSNSLREDTTGRVSQERLDSNSRAYCNLRAYFPNAELLNG